MSDHLEHNNLIARWLEGDLSESERKTLEDSAELNDLHEVLEDVKTWKLPGVDTSAGYEDLKSKMSTSRPAVKKIRMYSYLRYAAAAAILLLAYFGAQEFFTSAETKFALGPGETQQISLPDGSTAILDASSTLSYNSSDWDNERQLYLKGQAFFDVSKGKPFVVETSNGKVQVLGTEFNAKTSFESLSVVCYEGSVKVSNADSAHILQSGEGIRLSKTAAIRFNTTEERPSWTSGNGSAIRYRQAPLMEVVSDLCRQYNVHCTLPMGYQPLEFSGNVPRGNLEQALKTIFVPMEISYSLDDGEVQFTP